MKIRYNGVTVERPVDADGKVIDEPKFADPPRGTFSGSPEEFMSAKARAVMTPAEIEAMETEKAKQAGESRLSEIIAAKPVYIHAKPGWDKTRH